VVNHVPRDVSKRAERDGPGDSDGGGTHSLSTKVSNTRWCCDVNYTAVIVHCLYTCTLLIPPSLVLNWVALENSPGPTSVEAWTLNSYTVKGAAIKYL
jgi:hypothetical protein